MDKRCFILVRKMVVVGVNDEEIVLLVARYKMEESVCLGHGNHQPEKAFQ